jgi:catechol 2,3-dioxygenase-like lactoylglutathione lyase family enzyme
VIVKLDHIVLTVASIEATCGFYERALGFTACEQGGHVALHFGAPKINLHEAGHEFEPKARQALPGTGDFCLIADRPIEAVQSHLEALGIAIEVGPVARDGAVRALRSIYIRDPDGNLVEIANETG